MNIGLNWLYFYCYEVSSCINSIRISAKKFKNAAFKQIFWQYIKDHSFIIKNFLPRICFFVQHSHYFCVIPREHKKPRPPWGVDSHCQLTLRSTLHPTHSFRDGSSWHWLFHSLFLKTTNYCGIWSFIWREMLILSKFTLSSCVGWHIHRIHFQAISYWIIFL